MTTTAPDRCGNCGFSQKYSKQQKGERPGHTLEAVPPRVDVTGIPPNDGIYAWIDDEVYHRDLESLSSSGARDLLSSTPEEYDHNRRTPRDPKPQYDFGHAAHKMVLGAGSRLALLDPNVCGHGVDGKLAKSPASTAEWKKAEATARAHGKLPISKANMEKAQQMAGRVHSHDVAARLFANGPAEQSIYWHDDATGIRRRIRPDFLTEGLGRNVCIDYKTSTSANPAQFQRSVVDYGYHMQQAYYEDGLAELGLEDVAFLFVVQSKTAPFTVSVCQLDPDVVDLGRRQNRMALELFARCTESGRWPGYEGIHSVGMAGWAVKQIEDTLEVFNQPTN